jgi:WhiB family redox-sensing transcriptional regulator
VSDDAFFTDHGTRARYKIGCRCTICADAYARYKESNRPGGDDLPTAPDLPTGWMADGACKGMDTMVFFPEKGDHAGLRHAREVCGRCTVTEQCLDYALRTGTRFGVWGGTSERQRRALRRDIGEIRVRQSTHGTDGGYRQHLRAGTTPCSACREAHAAVKRRERRGDAA